MAAPTDNRPASGTNKWRRRSGSGNGLGIHAAALNDSGRDTHTDHFAVRWEYPRYPRALGEDGDGAQNDIEVTERQPEPYFKPLRHSSDQTPPSWSLGIFVRLITTACLGESEDSQCGTSSREHVADPAFLMPSNQQTRRQSSGMITAAMYRRATRVERTAISESTGCPCLPPAAAESLHGRVGVDDRIDGHMEKPAMKALEKGKLRNSARAGESVGCRARR